MERDQLTPAERQALDALPRDRVSPPVLEERTVRALRASGLIHAPRTTWSSRRPWIVAATVAAGIALFLGGYTVGQSQGTRRTAEALAALYPDRAERAAARVQSTGTAHAQALDALVQAMVSASAQEREEAGEVAKATLWAAAAEVVRLAPDDELAVRILQEFERQRAVSAERQGEARSVIWF
jgi:hypothetical protein